MSKSYLPAADGDFDAWQQNFISYAFAHWEEWDLDPTDLDPLINARDAWRPALAGHVAAQAAAQAARQLKDDYRVTCATLIREQVRRLQGHPQVRDSDRQAMGITVRDPSRTPVPPPATRPVAQVDTSERLRHTLAFVDESSSTSRARPEGAIGCEVWSKVAVAPPADPAELSFLGVASRSGFAASYAGTDAGKTAHYMLRWINAKGEKGPWSETVSATIGG